MGKELLYKFFEGKASQEEKEAIRIWLETNTENEKIFFREREFFDAITLSTSKQINMQKENSHLSIRTVARELLKIAALLAITITCGVIFYHLEIHQISEAMNKVTVPAGQRVNLTLPDGTNVWLNARSEIRYPAAFIKNKREVELNGEAYFEVTHRNGQPFVVRTNKCDIEVLGTKFNVEAYDDSDDFCTSLIEGLVRVSEKGTHSETVVLSPSQMVSLKNGHLLTSAIQDYDIFRWKEGLICFRNISFKRLMHRFEKSYGIKIVVENTHLDNYVCSGKFRISDGIDNALRILQKDANYVFERNKDESVIYIK